MKRSLLVASTLLLATPATAGAQEIARHPAAASSPILTGVTVRGGAKVTYLSGQVPPVIDSTKAVDSIEAYGDTRTQTIGVIKKIETALAAQGLRLGDVIKLTVFLVGDPKLGGKQDFKGFSEGYAQFFGTAAQPNKVARSTVQVTALVNPGWLIEIEATAAKAQ